VKEPEKLSACYTRPGVHLRRTAGFIAANKLITKCFCETISPVGACTIDHNDFRAKRPLAQPAEKWAYQQRFIKNRNDD
jgi:hypothetical protein